jgi:hypothetical protein
MLLCDLDKTACCRKVNVNPIAVYSELLKTVIKQHGDIFPRKHTGDFVTRISNPHLRALLKVYNPPSKNKTCNKLEQSSSTEIIGAAGPSTMKNYTNPTCLKYKAFATSD